MSPLSSVFIRSPLNLGEMMSFLRFHMPQIFVEFPLTNGGSLLLYGTTVVGSGKSPK